MGKQSQRKSKNGNKCGGKEKEEELAKEDKISRAREWKNYGRYEIIGSESKGMEEFD